MRLDKYLKVSRLIKRRSVAKEISDAGRVKINGKQAKSSSQLEIGDVLDIQYGQKHIRIEVLLFKDSTKKEDAEMLYKLLEVDA